MVWASQVGTELLLATPGHDISPSQAHSWYAFALGGRFAMVLCLTSDKVHAPRCTLACANWRWVKGAAGALLLLTTLPRDASSPSSSPEPLRCIRLPVGAQRDRSVLGSHKHSLINRKRKRGSAAGGADFLRSWSFVCHTKVTGLLNTTPTSMSHRTRCTPAANNAE